MLRSMSLLCILVAAMAGAPAAIAQQNAPAAPSHGSGIKRTPLQRFDLPGTSYEVVIGLAEIDPNVAIGRHTHPGPESGFLIEGSFELLVDGEPSRQLKAGESYRVPPQAVHDAKSGPAGAKVIATYVVEKGQPLASPVK